MTLKLYSFPLSTASANVFVTMYELGLEFELVHVNFLAGENKAPEYIAKQPFAVIPVLEDGDVCIFESRAIIRYLADRHGGSSSLYGKTLRERALVEQWLEVEAQNYFAPAMKLLTQTDAYLNLRPETLRDPTAGQHKEKLRQVLEIYDSHLANNKYLAGDFFSLADGAHFAPTQYLLLLSEEFKDLFQGHKHVFAWWTDISSRPSFQRALANGAPYLAG